MSKNKKRKKFSQTQLTALVCFVLFVVLFGAIIFLSKSHPQTVATTTGVDMSSMYKNHPTLGSDSAPVKVVEMGDFKCPACKAWEQTIYPDLKKEYIDTNKVQFIFANYPFIGPDSTTAALAAESVFHQDPASFWNYYNALYTNQPDEKIIWATPDYLVSLAQKTVPNIDMKKLRSDIDNKTYLSEVQADYAFGNNAQVSSTPSLFINGKLTDQGFDPNALKDMIDTATKEAQGNNGK